MDDRRFDDLTRAISEGTSRRAMLKGVLGGSLAALLAAIGLDDADAQELEADASCRRRCRRIENRRRRRRCLRRCQRSSSGGDMKIEIGDICLINSDCRSGNCMDEGIENRCRAAGSCPVNKQCGQVCCGTGLICSPISNICV